MSVARARRWLPALLLAQGILAIVFAWQTPAWEAPDEPWHLGYVTWLKTERRLPPLSPDILDTWVNQEASQPPLYYVLAAVASAPFDTSDMEGAFFENPGRWGGVGLEARNHNYALHGPWDAPFATELMRGLLLARLVAGAMALLATWATFQLAATMLPHRGSTALAAAAVLAFTPQMAFLSGAASNDTSAAALCTLTLWRAARLLRAPTDRNALWLGLSLGVALLTKSSALALVPLVGLALLSTALTPGHNPRDTLRQAVIALGIAAVVGGWWYGRNLLWYDTLYGRALHLAMPWARESPASLSRLVADGEPWLLFLSYWAAFGWGTIRWPDPMYQGVLLVCVLGGLGLLRGLRRGIVHIESPGAPTDQRSETTWRRLRARAARPEPRTALMLALFAAMVLFALVGWMQQVRAHWGRLLFPAAGALSVLLALGLRSLWPRARLPLVFAAVLAVWAHLAPWTAIRPALHPPPALAEREIAALDDRVDWRLGDVAELLAVQPAGRRAQVDGAWRVRLCWRALRRSTRDWQVLVHLVGHDDALVASYHSVPGDGTASTRAWVPGEAFCEWVDVLIDEAVPAPAVYDVAVGLFDAESFARLEARSVDGDTVGSDFVTRLKVEPVDPGWMDAAAESLATRHPNLERWTPPTRLGMDPFGADGDATTAGARSGEASAAAADGALRLLGHSLPRGAICAGDPLPVELLWQAGATAPPVDLQVQLHLRPWPGNPAPPRAQADGPPVAEGVAPATSGYPTAYWSPGEQVLDRRLLQLPVDLEPGDYALITGMYRLPDLVRATVSDAPEGSPAGEIRVPTAVRVDDCSATKP